MNEYYLIINNVEQGPFSLAVLKNKSVTPITKVWCEGMSGWVDARDVSELKCFFKNQPPPLPLFIQKPLIIQVEITKTARPISKSGIEKALAREIRLNFRNLCFAVGVSLLFGVGYFTFYHGFNKISLINRWTEYYDKNGHSSDKEYIGKLPPKIKELRKALISDSQKLNLYFDNYESYQSSIEKQLSYTMHNALLNMLVCFSWSYAILIAARFLTGIVIWVIKTAT